MERTWSLGFYHWRHCGCTLQGVHRPLCVGSEEDDFGELVVPLHCGTWRLNTGHQAWTASSLPTELFCCPWASYKLIKPQNFVHFECVAVSILLMVNNQSSGKLIHFIHLSHQQSLVFLCLQPRATEHEARLPFSFRSTGASNIS